MEFVQVVSVENMRKSDARTIAEHTPSAELMYRAAQGIFNSAKFVGRVAIVCGKGNNGGDGYALVCSRVDKRELTVQTSTAELTVTRVCAVRL